MLEQLNAMVNQAKIDMEKGIYSHAMGSYTQMENAICTSIFYWCQRFQVNVAVYFRSLELYDRFVGIIFRILHVVFAWCFCFADKMAFEGS